MGFVLKVRGKRDIEKGSFLNSVALTRKNVLYSFQTPFEDSVA